MKKILTGLLGFVLLTNLYAFDFGGFTKEVIHDTVSQVLDNDKTQQSGSNNRHSKISTQSFSSGYAPKEVVNGKTYNLAFFDIHQGENIIQDEIRYKTKNTRSGTFDNKHFLEVKKSQNKGKIKCNIIGYIEVPDEITTDKVYISIGKNYYLSPFGTSRVIRYNDANRKDYQKSEFFPVNVIRDENNNRAVKFNISIGIVHNSNSNVKLVSPGDIKFKIAPHVRSHKNKYQVAKIYVLEDA